MVKPDSGDAAKGSGELEGLPSAVKRARGGNVARATDSLSTRHANIGLHVHV
jgi:hypothetical protein